MCHWLSPRAHKRRQFQLEFLVPLACRPRSRPPGPARLGRVARSGVGRVVGQPDCRSNAAVARSPPCAAQGPHTKPGDCSSFVFWSARQRRDCGETEQLGIVLDRALRANRRIAFGGRGPGTLKGHVHRSDLQRIRRYDTVLSPESHLATAASNHTCASARARVHAGIVLERIGGSGSIGRKNNGYGSARPQWPWAARRRQSLGDGPSARMALSTLRIRGLLRSTPPTRVYPDETAAATVPGSDRYWRPRRRSRGLSGSVPTCPWGARRSQGSAPRHVRSPGLERYGSPPRSGGTRSPYVCLQCQLAEIRLMGGRSACSRRAGSPGVSGRGHLAYDKVQLLETVWSIQDREDISRGAA